MDKSHSTRAIIKEIYCAVCDKWLPGCYASRHENSQKQREKLTAYKTEHRHSIERPSTSTESLLQTPGKQPKQQNYDHYRIEGSTLKKCPPQPQIHLA